MLDVEKKKLELNIIASRLKNKKHSHHWSIISIPTCSLAVTYMRSTTKDIALTLNHGVVSENHILVYVPCLIPL